MKNGTLTASGAEGHFDMTGGVLVYAPANGPLFYVTNTTAVVNLKAVKVDSGSAVLVQAAAGNWGSSGANGGTVILNASDQALKGNLVADVISSISLALKDGSSLAGAIDAEATAKSASLALDKTSSWNVTADSYLTCLDDAAGILGTAITNITGNGHTVYYNAGACPALAGQSYSLNGGGTLKPAQ